MTSRYQEARARLSAMEARQREFDSLTQKSKAFFVAKLSFYHESLPKKWDTLSLDEKFEYLNRY